MSSHSTNLITNDRRMLEIIQLAKTVAQSRATVLIQGESGTGKELIAHVIKEYSTRANRPFVAVNCAAIPENLLESELFGYERGAFTGALNANAGKFERANTGTLFLDEISEMDIRLQAKLLRVLQEGEVDRIGGKSPIPVDIRIIATTNRNLAKCVQEGLFREDLFYRLNVVNLTLPALRDRIGDIRLLAQHFLFKYSERNKKELFKFSSDAISLLESHNWPGNVRELENVIERAVITAAGSEVTIKDLLIERRDVSIHLDRQGDSSIEASNWAPGKTLNEIERDVILMALKFHNGNRTHTARALGISIRTLRNKLADYRKIGINA